MAIGGLGGGLLAGLSGIAQGLKEAQQQREQQQLMQVRQAQLKRINEEDAASSGLFGSILGGLGDVSGGTALTNPMMAGPQAPMPGQGSMPSGGFAGGDRIASGYSPTPQGSGMSSGLSNPGSLAMAESPEIQETVAHRIATSPAGGGIQHWSNFNAPLNAALRAAGLPTSGPLTEEQWRRAKPLVMQYESGGGQNIPNYRFDAGHTAGGPFQITNSTFRNFGGPAIAASMRGAGAEPQQPPETMLRGGGAPPVAPPSAGGDEYTGMSKPGRAYIPFMGGDIPDGSSGTGQAAPPQPPSGGPGAVSETGIALPGDGQRPAAPQAQQQAPAAMPRLMATAPPPVQQQVQQGAAQTAQAIPQAAWGKMSLPALAQQIEKNNPGASGVVKMMMLEKAQKLMAPMELRQWEMWKLQHNDAIHTADQQFTRDTALLAEDRANRRLDRTEAFQTTRDERTADRQEAHDERLLGARNPPAGHAQVLTDPTNNQQYLMDPNKPGSATTLTGEPYTPGGAQRLGGSGAGSVINKDAVQFLAESIADYRAPLPPGGRSTPFNQAVEAKVREINPQYDATKYDAKRRGLVAFTSGRQSDSVRSFSVAIDHLDTMAEAAAALENGDVQLLNRVQNRVQTEFGYPGAVDFNFAKSIVGAEISKAIVGGVGALTDREELRDSFSAANSPAQLKAVADRAKKLIAGQLGGYRRQAAASGFSEQQFDAALSPQAKRELYGLTGGAPPAQGAQPQQQAVPAEGARPLPAGAENDPDGFGYRIGGKVYVKRGNQIVPHEGAEPTPRQ